MRVSRLVSLMPGNFCSGRHRQILSGHGRRKAAGKFDHPRLVAPPSGSARQKNRKGKRQTDI